MTTEFSETSISLSKKYWSRLEYNRRIWFTTKSNPGKVFSFLVSKGLALIETKDKSTTKPAIKLHTSYKKEGDRSVTFTYDDIIDVKIEPTAMEYKLYTTMKQILGILKK